MRNQTKSQNKLLLLKVKIASVDEVQMMKGGGRKKRGTNSKTGDTKQQVQGQLIGQFQDADAFIFM